MILQQQEERQFNQYKDQYYGGNQGNQGFGDAGNGGFGQNNRDPFAEYGNGQGNFGGNGGFGGSGNGGFGKGQDSFAGFDNAFQKNQQTVQTGFSNPFQSM